jgi:cellulose 1,4-beta-cellobiosidase
LKCSGLECGEGDNRYKGVCDKDGCDLNPFRAGVQDFYGPGKTVDSTKPLTVVTQFITTDGTDTGDLKEIKRIFVQDGKVFEHPESKVPGIDTQHNSITDDMCDAFKTTMGDKNDFKAKGGLKQMGKSMDNGMVLVMSIWDDHEANMLWLDSTYPTDKTTIGGPRGNCATTSGKPSDVESQHPNAGVKFSDVKFGELNSTYTPGPGPTPPGPTPTPGCPGGNLSACIGLCPSTPAVAFQACVSVCVSRCSSAEAFL